MSVSRGTLFLFRQGASVQRISAKAFFTLVNIAVNRSYSNWASFLFQLSLVPWRRSRLAVVKGGGRKLAFPLSRWKNHFPDNFEFCVSNKTPDCRATTIFFEKITHFSAVSSLIPEKAARIDKRTTVLHVCELQARGNPILASSLY